MTTLWKCLFLLATVRFTASFKVEYSVKCHPEGMRVFVRGPTVSNVELFKWGQMKGCEAEKKKNYFQFDLPYETSFHCGLTRVRNTLTGEITYYHRVSVTDINSENKVIMVKCHESHLENSTISNIVKRDVLPPEFVEPDFIEITSEVSGKAPEPILGVGVRQNGNLVNGQINVVPGTPLTMEVFLDENSASTYGILVNYMEVTDRNDKKETIVFNGCSLDSYLFENFLTETGDYLAAKFRAFKFPESNYVLFQGTVDVCLDKCKGIQCSNGQIGFGRRRRSVLDDPADPNKIFEVTMVTYIQLQDSYVKSDESIIGEEQFFPVKKSSPFYKSFFQSSDNYEESPLLEREPPSIVFKNKSSICQHYLSLLISCLIVLFLRH